MTAAKFNARVDGVFLDVSTPDSGQVELPGGAVVSYQSRPVPVTRVVRGVESRLTLRETRFEVLAGSDVWTGWALVRRRRG